VLILVLVALGVAGVAALFFHLGQTSQAPASGSPSSGAVPSTVPTIDPEVVAGPLPDIADTPKAIAAAVRGAFGQNLASVSVETTYMVGLDIPDGTKQYFFHVKYSLIGQMTTAETFVPSVNGTGLLPPLSHSDRDRMGPTRFDELLRAYSNVTDEPFGALESWRTAYQESHFGDAVGDVMAIFGKDRPTRDIWVITPGTATQRDFRRLQYDSSSVPGYVFSFPVGGHPEFIFRARDMGEWVYIED
jgi:hypothetical protein